MQNTHLRRKLNLWIYVVYRIQEKYNDGDMVETHTPVAGYEKREDAVAHAKAATTLRLFGKPNKWDPFMMSVNFPSYIVGTLPLILPSSVDSAPEEMESAIQVLRDSALETADKALARTLPPVPSVFPLWGIGGVSRSEITHYFDGKPKPYLPGGQTNTSLCGVLLPGNSYNILQVSTGTRQCLTCLGLLNKKKTSVATPP